MDINALPKYDMSDNPTNCCPRFNTDGWDEQELHFKDKLFVKTKTRSIFIFRSIWVLYFRKPLAQLIMLMQKLRMN